MARKITTEIFVAEMKEKFGDRYIYDKVEYKSAAKDKICVICPKHGEFWTLPSNLRAGYGCPKCKVENRTKTTEDFIKESKERFGDKFDYSKTIYTGRKKPLTLICPIHGEVSVTPNSHFNSPEGCPKCGENHAHESRTTLINGQKRKEMREYRIWRGMKTRVTNPNTDDADRYLNRGITCCERWMESFEAFYEDMGPCPEGYSIDRIDPNGNYCPENCRWASAKTQAENRGDFNIVITYNGETHVLKEWAKIFKINYTTLYTRMYRNGLSFEEAIKDDPFNRLYEFKGEKKTLVEWCKIYKIKYNTVICRMSKHHWTLAEALLTPYKHRKVKVQDMI